MSSTVFYRRRAERFAQLLDEAGGARRHHVHSRVDGELGPMLAVSDRIVRLEPQVTLDPDFRAGLRAMLVATAEREGIGATAAPPPGPARAARRAARQASRRLTGPAARRARARGAVIIGIAAGTLALSGMSAASGDAVPGDALYGIKRSTERAQLALAGSDTSRGQLYLEFAKTRVNEARAVRADAAGLAAVLADMDAETTQGVRLLNTAAVNRRDPVALDAVDRFVEVQRRSVAALLDGQPADRERVLDSLSLLDAVTKRTAALRTSLTCGVATNDLLGPVPKTCGAAPARPGVPVPPTHTGSLTTNGPIRDIRTDPLPVEGGGTSTAPSAPGSAPAEPAADENGGLLADLGRILGGLLG